MTTSIDNLPNEIFYVIAIYLGREDIETCFNVCKKWRSIFNNNKIWKRHCLYSEKYLQNYNNNNQLLKLGENKQKTDDVCLWRQYYVCQMRLWENWNKGKFKKEKTGILIKKDTSSLNTFLDKFGNSWLISNSSDGITVWNITESPYYIHCVKNDTDQIGLCLVNDKLVTFRSDYIKVLKFSGPKYKLELQYRFIFSMDSVLPINDIVSEDYYTCCVRFIVVGDIFVGYTENLQDLHVACLHIWNLDEGKKIATQSVFQQSFVDYVFSCTGNDITKKFDGGLLLFEGDFNQCLITLIDDRFSLCQISLYDLVHMRFISIIAQVKSKRAWCFMKGDVVAIYHLVGDNTSQISLYNVTGHFLTKLDFPFCNNPAMSGDFYFCRCKVILKVECDVHVLSISGSNKIFEHTFKASRQSKVIRFFEPKYLMLYTIEDSVAFLNVYDIEKGVVLWNLGPLKLEVWNTYKYLLQKLKYPGKLLLHIEGDKEMSIFNFEP